MRNEDLTRKLKALVDAPDDDFEAAQRDLDQIREAIQDGVFSATPAQVKLEPGFRTNFGLQIKMDVHTATNTYTLFRANVPETGYPIRLDLYGEELEQVDDAKQLEERVFKFLSEPQTKATLQTLRRYAT